MKTFKGYRKVFYGILIAIIVVLIVYDIWFRLFFWVGYDKNIKLATLMKQVIGSTHNKMFIEKSNILNIDKKSWNFPSCKPMYYYDEFKKNKLAPLKKCIIITVDPPIQKPFCNHLNYKDCIAISLHEYALSRPDILKKIIEVAKKPCSFFPDEKSYYKSIKSSFAPLPYPYPDEESYLKSHLINYNQNLESLQCDKSVGSRKLETIILNFIDANKQRQFQMIVKREE